MRQRLVFAMIVLLAFLLPLSAVGCAPPSADAQVRIVLDGHWEVVLQTEVRQPVRMAAFLDEAFGVTGGMGGDGRAHYTTTGGETWIKAETSGGCLYGVDVVDAQTVWVCGRMVGQSFSTPGGIRLSVDGGQTWNEQTTYQTTPGFCPLSFLDAKTGWVANAGKLSATTDGGETWEEITPDSSADIAAISLRKPGEGYVLDYDGNLYITLDGGKSWSSQTVGLEKYGEMRLMPSDELASAAVRFLDADHGIVVLSLVGGADNKIVALHTADGGQTWEEEALPTEFGKPYLTQDGEFLTVASFINSRKITVLRYVAD